MSISPFDLALYAGALLILFLTPGPVWLALLARTLAGGFASAWPLALGVVVGDMLWPLAAIFGLAWIVSVYSEFMLVLRWAGAAIFLVMGIQLIRHASRAIHTDGRLTQPGAWPGFAAGLIAILGNPKAILFYMGVLPGFFNLSAIGTVDVIAIVGISMAVPFFGNLIFALGIDRLRVLLQSPEALRCANQIAGGLLIAVGVVIALN